MADPRGLLSNAHHLSSTANRGSPQHSAKTVSLMMNLSRLFSSILLVLTIISNSATLAHAAEADDAPHWAFVAPVRPETPPADGHWALNPIDHFILERLTEAGFEPSPAAARCTSGSKHPNTSGGMRIGALLLLLLEEAKQKKRKANSM